MTIPPLSVFDQQNLSVLNEYLNWLINAANAGTSPFTIQTVTIYARTDGSNATGNGSLGNPYATFQRAIQDVPIIVPAGSTYIVDITGIIEELPSDFTLPAWKCPGVEIFSDPTPYSLYQTPIEIFATPQPVAAIPLADTIINFSDVASVTVDPITGLQTVTLLAPRASWTTANLVGKQIVDAASPLFDGDIAAVTANTTILVSSGSVFGGGFTFPLNIAEPSANLHGSGVDFGTLCVFNVDIIGFTGISITSDNEYNGLYVDGNGVCICQFCNLDSPFLVPTSASATFSHNNRLYISHVFNSPTLGGGLLVAFSFFDQTQTLENFGVPLFSTPTILSIVDSIFFGSDAIEVMTYCPGGIDDAGAAPHIFLSSVLCRDGVGDGFVFHGARALVQNCDFSSSTGNGITVNGGAGQLVLHNVGSTTENGGFGVAITDGMQVVADVATTTTQPGDGRPLAGTSGDISVGSAGTKAWSTLTSAPNNVADYTGTSATGARISQG